MEERRRFKRVTFGEPVEYHMIEEPIVSAFEGNKFGGCAGCDLSEGGVRLQLNNFVPLKAGMSVTFSLLKNPVTGLEGRVAWVQKVPYAENYQMGLEFQETGSIFQTRADIRQYVEKTSQ